jgi:hypothetical protein
MNGGVIRYPLSGIRLLEKSLDPPLVFLREPKATEESRHRAAPGVTAARGEGFFAPLRMTICYFNSLLIAKANS